MAAHAAFGMMPGVDRPALATTIPTRSGRRCCSMPVPTWSAGRSTCCSSPSWARVYARLALGIERPRVGLLSIGEEETKGNELTREAHRLLKAAPLNFIGNIEGREIYSGVADVIVCDGFTGNVVLKTSEGLVETVEALLGDELQGTFSARGICCRGGRSAVPPTAWTTRNTAARRCSAWPAWSSSATAARRRRRCATRSPWPYRLRRSDFIARVEREIAAATVS